MYCIAAIWSNIELFLGIIAANLTLSRAVYLYFFRPNHNHPSSSYTSDVLSPRSRSSFPSTKLRGDCVSRTNTIVECPNRMLTNRSSNSEIELVPGIQKKTEFWLSEGEDIEKRGQRGKV
jgi:hypothetical protein